MKLQLENWSFINRIHLKSMYRRALCLPVLGFLSFGLFAQNLVPNPSFEDYTSCPTSNGDNQIVCAYPWKGTNTSTDYFNSCANLDYPSVGVPNPGGQYARSGEAMAGLYMLNVAGLDYREYLQVPLNQQLEYGHVYCISFYVHIEKKSNYAVNNFGGHFTDMPFTTPEFSQGYQVAPYIPEINLFGNPIISDTDWVEIKSIYYGNGNEYFFTIGNYFTDIQTDKINTGGVFENISYYYFDDVSVEEITTPFWQYHDTTIYYGDSVLIGPAITGLDIDWYTANMEFISNSPGIYVTPPTSRNFIAKETFNGTETTHVVHVTVIGGAGIDENEMDGLLVYPNPSQGEIKIAGQDLSGIFELTISDLSGKAVYAEKRTFAHSTESFYPRVQKGMYVLMLTNPETGARMQRRVLIQD